MGLLSGTAEEVKHYEQAQLVELDQLIRRIPVGTVILRQQKEWRVVDAFGFYTGSSLLAALKLYFKVNP